MRISRVVSTLRRIFIAGLINVPMLALAAVTPINNAQLSGTTQIVPITQTSIVEAASNGVLSGFPYSTANNGQALEVSAGMLSWQPVLVNPMTTIGDIIVGQISGAPGRLPIGANTYVLTSNGSTASWQPTASSGGTVTTISVVTANGVSATISNPTTTPALTFSLGAITPSTINGVTISGSGTLAMGSNSLNIGAGGTLGSNAFTSTAYAPIASPTFTGTVTTPALTLGSSTGAVQATAGVLSVITNTGTGNNVLATSPTITTPTISGHFTAEGVTTTGATGTGNLVFSASPTFTGTLSAATVTASGVVTGSGVKLTGLISTSVLATDGSGNIIAGSSLSNPMTTTGDIIYSSNNSGTPARLGIGSNGNVLTVSGGIPAWGSAGSGTVTHTVGALISGNIVVGNGGGDIQTSLLSISSDTISAAPGADLVLSGGTTVSNVQLTPVGSGVGLLLSPNTTASFNIQSSATSATTNIGQLLFQLKDSSGTQNTSSITTSLSTTTHGSDVSYLTFNTLAISSTLSEGMRLTGATLSLNNLTAYAASNLTLTAGSGNQDIILATTGTGPLVFQSNAQVAIQYIQNLTAVSTSNASEFITQLNDSAGFHR